jgi:hypothetical protein
MTMYVLVRYVMETHRLRDDLPAPYVLLQLSLVLLLLQPDEASLGVYLLLLRP